MSYAAHRKVNNNHLVSVVIPTYNQEKFIAETIESVIQQTYPYLEIILADDCSQDGTVEIIKSYAAADHRIKPLFSLENQGISKNFNRAFDACTGKYIAFLGGDDVMYPEKLKTQVDILEKNPSFALVHHDAEIINETGERVGKLSDSFSLPSDPLDWPLFYDWSFSRKPAGVLPSTCLATSSYYLYARYSEKLKYKHELFFTIESFCADPSGKWMVLKEALTKYRIHDTNFSRQDSNRKLISEETEKMVKMVCNEYPQLSSKAQDHLHFVRFKHLMFGWEKKDKKEKWMQFLREAGPVKFMWLLICRILVKANMFWPLVKIIKIAKG
jgi:glycosyltransferase involved in cell wall biosynthesis